MSNLPADLVMRLRAYYATEAEQISTLGEAADEIERLRAKLSRVHDALERVDPAAASIARAAIEPPGLDGLFVDNVTTPADVPEKCPDGLLPDGEVCPRCKGRRGPSGIGGGSWVHY